ncbi:MAG: DUF429 domain-containing protein [Actinomycetota bacterium]
MSPAVVGVDGCRGGWAVVRAGADDALSATWVADLHALVAEVRSGAVAVAAVDMPIGLLADRPRPADVAARALLGARRSTVFPAPVRSVLGAVDYADACRRSREACGKALSKQAFNLVPAIRHLDAVLGPADADRIVEAHPELAFARLDGGRPLPSKRSPEGRRQRRRLLTDALGPELDGLVDGGAAPAEDLLDAAVLVLTARHVVAGSAHRLGDGVVDETGKRVQVVY